MLRVWVSIAAFVVALQASSTAAADPVTRFCGSAPRTDTARTAPIKVAQRLLTRLLTTRARVFKAYKHQYEKNRTRIITRNKKLPKKQHLPVPVKLTDGELKETEQYKKRIAKAHASPADEEAARARLEAEESNLRKAQLAYEVCGTAIIDRIKAAPKRPAEALMNIPADKRLAEEIQRLAQLKAAYLESLETKRKDKKTMAPILSAAICGHKRRIKTVDGEIRNIKRRSKLAKTDPSADIEALKERREEHLLEIVELKRDIRLFKSRAKRCRRMRKSELVGCLEQFLGAPNRIPALCKPFSVELELLGYAKRPWQ